MLKGPAEAQNSGCNFRRKKTQHVKSRSGPFKRFFLVVAVRLYSLRNVIGHFGAIVSYVRGYSCFLVEDSSTGWRAFYTEGKISCVRRVVIDVFVKLTNASTLNRAARIAVATQQKEMIDFLSLSNHSFDNEKDTWDGRILPLGIIIFLHSVTVAIILFFY